MPSATTFRPHQASSVYHSLMAQETYLQVRVTPRSSSDEIVGWREGVLVVRLRAPPVEGQANEALRRFLARRLDLILADIEVVSGAASRTKRLRVYGVSATELRQRLAPSSEPQTPT